MFRLPYTTAMGILTPQECSEQIQAAESCGFADAPVTTSLGPRMRPEARNNTRVMLDSTAIANALWPRIQPHALHVPGWHPIGLNERIRYYRYEPGQYFAPHRDGYFERSPGERSMVTVLIYLNEGYEGGTTVVEGDTIVPHAGMALLFHHPLIHESVPLQTGRKYVLRTDLMYRMD